MRLSFPAVCAVLTCAALTLTGCATGSAAGPTRSGQLSVVAAENFWGSIAEQLGGTRVTVTSLINSPDADPHEYEPTASDARAIATADVVVVNGVGYDTWASKLIAAGASPNRATLDVGHLLSVPVDANPHRWYNPADVAKVAIQITADYKNADPADAAYFDQQYTAFTTSALAEYHATIADITARFAGTAVGASESIVAMLTPALGLDLITPPSFLAAISQGIDPTAADKTTIDHQIASGAIKVYIYNPQNATPDIQAQLSAAEARGIPIAATTETMPAGASSWQQWQTNQLHGLRDALAKATGR